MDTRSKTKILRSYGKFHTGTHSDSVGEHTRKYAVVYRFGHPIMFSGKTREKAIDRLYADIRDLMLAEIHPHKKGVNPF